MSDEQVQQSRVQIVRNPDLQTIYSNNVNMAMNSFEVRITFLDTIPSTDEQGGIAIAKEKISVVMTPEFARVFCVQLAKGLHSFEASFGKFRQIARATEDQDGE